MDTHRLPPKPSITTFEPEHAAPAWRADRVAPRDLRDDLGGTRDLRDDLGRPAELRVPPGPDVVADVRQPDAFVLRRKPSPALYIGGGLAIVAAVVGANLMLGSHDGHATGRPDASALSTPRTGDAPTSTAAAPLPPIDDAIGSLERHPPAAGATPSVSTPSTSGAAAPAEAVPPAPPAAVAPAPVAAPAIQPRTPHVTRAPSRLPQDPVDVSSPAPTRAPNATPEPAPTPTPAAAPTRDPVTTMPPPVLPPPAVSPQPETVPSPPPSPPTPPQVLTPSQSPPAPPALGPNDTPVPPARMPSDSPTPNGN